MPVIIPGDLEDPRIIEMLERHLHRARAETAPGSAHALAIDGLRRPEIRFFAAWEGESLLGIGALLLLSAAHGEIKSMYTAEAAHRLYRRHGFIDSAPFGDYVADPNSIFLTLRLGVARSTRTEPQRTPD